MPARWPSAQSAGGMTRPSAAARSSPTHRDVLGTVHGAEQQVDGDRQGHARVRRRSRGTSPARPSPSSSIAGADGDEQEGDRAGLPRKRESASTGVREPQDDRCRPGVTPKDAEQDRRRPRPGSLRTPSLMLDEAARRDGGRESDDRHHRRRTGSNRVARIRCRPTSTVPRHP